MFNRDFYTPLCTELSRHGRCMAGFGEHSQVLTTAYF